MIWLNSILNTQLIPWYSFWKNLSFIVVWDLEQLKIMIKGAASYRMHATSSSSVVKHIAQDKYFHEKSVGTTEL